MAENTPKTYGGMAVVEGVMMRSPGYFSVACRAPDGRIVLKTEPIEKTWLGRQKWLLKPFLRGTFAMLDTMVFGIRAMNFAANIQTDPEYATAEDKAKAADGKGPGTVSNFAIGLTLVTSLALGFALFNAAPQFVSELIVRWSGGDLATNKNGLLTNYVAETVKLVFIIGYLAAISFYPPIREVFRYHGAEHKAINCLEDGSDLTVANVQKCTRLHPRCGTNFVIIVFVVSFLLQPLIPRDLFVPLTSPTWLLALTRLPVELAMMPVVAGVSYELIRLAGKMKNAAWVKIALAPGLATQLITTAEPNDAHTEVAIAALVAAQRAEETGVLENGVLGEDGIQSAETNQPVQITT